MMELRRRHAPDAAERAWLLQTNVAMKQIDLSCQVATPGFAGFFIGAFENGDSRRHRGDLSGAALLVGLVNEAALVVEYVCTARIYALIPKLAIKSPVRLSSRVDLDEEVLDRIPRLRTSSEQDRESKMPLRTIVGTSCGMRRLPNGLRTYFERLDV